MSTLRVCCVEGCTTRCELTPNSLAATSDYRDGSMGKGRWSVAVNVDGTSNNNEIFVCNRHVRPDHIALNPECSKNRAVACAEPDRSDSHNLPIFCRLCLAEDVQMVYPKEIKGYQQLVTKISECLQITISVDEMQRSFICIKCNNSLEQFKQFRNRCARQNGYLTMRQSLEPERNQPLRYKENWYWYSCLGNNLSTVYWGCSVVCCPAFIITRPSGKVCSNFAQHQHKQKIDDVKLIYCNGEYIYDRYRYSFDMINPNRTVQFSCRNLNDPYRKCSAILTCNDKSEVLSIGEHNHPMETILESAFKLFGSSEKRAVTMIRGNHLELAVCLGFWYGTTANESSVSHWECIRPSCSGSITLKDGVIKLNGQHSHQQVWLKWGAAACRTPDSPKIIMKIINPVAVNSLGNQHSQPTDEHEQTSLESTNAQFANTSETESSTVITQIKLEDEDQSYETNIQSNSVEQTSIPVCSQEIVQVQATMPRTFADIWAGNEQAVLENETVGNSSRNQEIFSSPMTAAHEMSIRSNHPITIVRRQTSTNRPLRRILPRIKPLNTGFRTEGPKIVHVMSLSKPQHGSESNLTASVTAPMPLLMTRASQEPCEEEEPETITDEVMPCVFAANKSDMNDTISDIQPIVSCNSESSTCRDESDNINAAYFGEDTLYDLDDEEIPPIVPIDVPTLPKKSIMNEAAVNSQSTDLQPSAQSRIPEESRISNSALAGTRRVSESFSQNSSHLTIAKVVQMNEQQSTKTYVQQKIFTPPFSSKRANPKVFQVHGTTIKRYKADDPSKSIHQTAARNTSSIDVDNTSFNNSPDDPLALPERLLEGTLDDHEQNSNAIESIDSETIQDIDAHKTVETITTEQHAESSSKLSSTIESNVAPLPSAKTVQLVKLQKSEQMLNFEGHLYKIKWSNNYHLYWDCMLREQVNCMAILETNGNDVSHWVRHGMHNHKVPKPIANEDSSGKYQMFTAATGIGNVKRVPHRTIDISSIEEQKGKIMFLKKKKIFNFWIKRLGIRLLLQLINYQYEIKEANVSGFRWKCTSCNSMLDTDEKFTIAKVVDVMHNHGPKVPIIDLALCDEFHKTKKKLEQPESIEQQVEAQHDQQEEISNNEISSTDLPREESRYVAKQPKAPIVHDARFEGDEDEWPEDAPTAESDIIHDEINVEDELSDDDEIVLDPISGEFISRMDMKRKRNRELLLEQESDNDDNITILDPLTGKFCRKGDIQLVQADFVDDDHELTTEEESQCQTDNVITPSEDFEELLAGKPEPDAAEQKKQKRLKRDSLASLKKEINIQKHLLQPDPQRNFTVVPTSNKSCWIRFNDYAFQFERLDQGISYWICAVPPQYACRGRVVLDAQCRTASYPRPICALHSHEADLQNMFDAHKDQEQGEIPDTHLEVTHKYTFYKDDNNSFQLLLDDGFLYSCSTISKNGISSWRCDSRQKENCKAIITMQGNFVSLVRNRFTHAHPAQSTSEEHPVTHKNVICSEDSIPKSGFDRNNEVHKKRKRQTL